MAQISILGCGWLGLPLAKHLLGTGVCVKGSTTSQEKIGLLQNTGISAFQIVLSENQITGDISTFLQDSETLIIDIPPRLRSVESESFVSKIQLLVPFIEKSDIKHVLFISSTSVYGDTFVGIIDENYPLHPQTESGKQLVLAEAILKTNLHFQTTILRFGGLIGKDRHPVYHLAGRQNVENPDAPINLIHQEDCIHIIASILQKNIWNHTFNAVAPFHPTRKEYYTKKAIEFKLEPPVFKPEKSHAKIISCEKIHTVLHYKFQRTTDF